MPYCQDCGKPISSSSSGCECSSKYNTIPSVASPTNKLEQVEASSAASDAADIQNQLNSSFALTKEKKIDRVEPDSFGKDNHEVPNIPLRPLRSTGYPTILRRLPLKTLLRVGLGGAILLAFLLAGILNAINSFGDGRAHSNNSQSPTISVFPTIVAHGALVRVRGNRFQTETAISLTLDNNMPLMDTARTALIHSDYQGNFSDTFVVQPDWVDGPHTVHAEDAVLHKIASYSITVTGHGRAQRPAHLQVSTNTLDMGAGDPTTSKTQVLVLSNIGGGQINWQTAVTQSWLQVGPQQGTFFSGQNVQVAIAVSRAQLAPGTYEGQIVFLSDAGEVSVTIKMSVTPLLVVAATTHQATLQIDPPILTFVGKDGSGDPATQRLTLTNPGQAALRWQAQTNTSDGQNWLQISQNNNTLESGGVQALMVMVDTSRLLPGTYTGRVHILAQGDQPVLNGDQSVYVSLTIQPQCMLNVTPGTLSFMGAYQHANPPEQTFEVTTDASCTGSQNWTAETSTQDGHPWLRISTGLGVTPSRLRVSASTSGMGQGIYNGQITLHTDANTLILPVSLQVAPPNVPILQSNSNAMNFNAILGSGASQIPGSVVLSNSGTAQLNWQAAAITSSGGDWLHLSNQDGQLTPGQSKEIAISAQTLPEMVPGDYNGQIAFSATDSSGKPLATVPPPISISFSVQLPCGFSVSPKHLSFTDIIGGPNPSNQMVVLATSGNCTQPLNWSTMGNPDWLIVTPDHGTLTPGEPLNVRIGISAAGLSDPSYVGQMVFKATDSGTGRPIGRPQPLTVDLTVQPQCTLQSPSSLHSFEATQGTNPANQTFSIGLSGTCSGQVTLTTKPLLPANQRWLTITPSGQVTSDGSTIFIVSISSASLPAGTYDGQIQVNANAVDGHTLAGSPQVLQVGLKVNAAHSIPPTPVPPTVVPPTPVPPTAVPPTPVPPTPVPPTVVPPTVVPPTPVPTPTHGPQVNSSQKKGAQADMTPVPTPTEPIQVIPTPHPTPTSTPAAKPTKPTTFIMANALTNEGLHEI